MMILINLFCYREKVFILMNIWIPGKDLLKLYCQIKTIFTLNLEDITDKDYEHAQKVWEVFEIKILASIMTYMFKAIHYCLQMYLRTLEICVLKCMSLILPSFYLHRD